MLTSLIERLEIEIAIAQARLELGQDVAEMEYGPIDAALLKLFYEQGVDYVLPGTLLAATVNARIAWLRFVLAVARAVGG
jgi:hypothetical protein